MRILVFLAFLFAWVPLAVSAAAKPSRQNAAPTGALNIVHTSVTSLPSARIVIKPLAREVAWLKSQAEGARAKKSSLPQKQLVKTKLVELFKKKKTFQGLVVRPCDSSDEDAFFLRVRFVNKKTPSCLVQTKHEDCPAWVTYVIKAAAEQAVADARRATITNATGALAVLACLVGAGYKNKLDAKREEEERLQALRNALEEARREEEERLQAQRRAQEEEARRQQEEEARRQQEALGLYLFKSEFKRFLCTTPFLNFVIGDEKEAPGNCKPNTMKLARRTIHLWCRTYNTDFFGADFTLTDDQLFEFLTGSFKEETIDSLADFQQRYMAAMRLETESSNDTVQKALVLGAFIERVIALQKSDPVEAKRILCFHPWMVWEAIEQAPFFASFEGMQGGRIWSRFRCVYHNGLYIEYARSPSPYSSESREMFNTRGGSHLRDNFYAKESFKVILEDAVRPDRADGRPYCLSHYFPCDIAMFEGLHLVKAAA